MNYISKIKKYSYKISQMVGGFVDVDVTGNTTYDKIISGQIVSNNLFFS